MTAVQMQRPEGGAVVTHTNITGRKEVEDRLRRSEQHLRESREEYRALARKLLTAREDASRRLARELHDSFSQRMALISMLAAKMEIDCSDSEKNRQGLRRIQEEMTQLLGDLHDIARQLHPQIIEDLGLPDAVASFCTSFSKYEGIPIEFVPGELPAEMPRKTALNLYRIIQESLSNTAKHAKATSVHIDLGTRAGSLHLSIKDDGVGFDPDAIRGKKRLGLVSLRERASIIGGNIDISSAPGSGTTVSVEVPLHAD
jgi:signal transduction histidine kinase